MVPSLEAPDLASFAGRDRVLGLGEMMNTPGVLSGDEGIIEKLRIFSLVDGHAPMLSGNALNAYILAGPQSDHECTGEAEARESSPGGCTFTSGRAQQRRTSMPCFR